MVEHAPPASGYGNVVNRTSHVRTDRIGAWMQGYKGKPFWPMDPHPEDIDVETIAHALSMQNRFGGHLRVPYSVAQHCLLASYFQPDVEPFEKLMHDASEAYLQDVPRPIKRGLGMDEYNRIEDLWHKCLAAKFGFTYPYSNAVKLADEVMLHSEAAAMMNKGPWHDIIDWTFIKQFKPDELPKFKPMTPLEAELAWLTRFHDLTNGKWT